MLIAKGFRDIAETVTREDTTLNRFNTRVKRYNAERL